MLFEFKWCFGWTSNAGFFFFSEIKWHCKSVLNNFFATFTQNTLVSQCTKEYCVNTACGYWSGIFMTDFLWLQGVSQYSLSALPRQHCKRRNSLIYFWPLSARYELDVVGVYVWAELTRSAPGVSNCCLGRHLVGFWDTTGNFLLASTARQSHCLTEAQKRITVMEEPVWSDFNISTSQWTSEILWIKKYTFRLDYDWTGKFA